MKRQRVVRAMTSFLLTLLLVCACVVPGFAVSADRLTAAEQQTQRLVGDVLAQNSSAVRALKRGGQYRAFLDEVAARQNAWVARETRRTAAALKERGISPTVKVAALRRSEAPAAQDLYRDLLTWLV